ncbi:DNA alkylation repair protein [Gemmobacter denitrificans]|uniref:DNA alkylation repair protein n=1 Tax=Gemmobacter denitrificans TaxID=3123040 RepID=A0ABU8BYT2_9RHOB
MVKQSRTGAAKVADVAPDILARLNAGEIEAATLSENLATDLAALMAAVLPELAGAAAQIDPKAGITRRMATAAQIIHDHSGLDRLDWLARHPSDLVRGWGAYLVAADPAGSLQAKLRAMRPFADDAHFGVREWAWLALRPAIVAEPEVAIAELTPLTGEASEYLRRFACEAIRPRGVWASHIKLLKDEPHHALPLLDPLRADPSRYVQDSVANWLNDAWKSQPVWVEGLCDRWAAQSQAEATSYIRKRALRNKK